MTNVLTILYNDQAKNGDLYMDVNGKIYRVVKGTVSQQTHLQLADGQILPESYLRGIEIEGFKPRTSLTRLHVARHHMKNLKREQEVKVISLEDLKKT